MAQNGPAAAVPACLQLRDERTWLKRAPRSVDDPHATLANSTFFTLPDLFQMLSLDRYTVSFDGCLRGPSGAFIGEDWGSDRDCQFTWWSYYD